MTNTPEQQAALVEIATDHLRGCVLNHEQLATEIVRDILTALTQPRDSEAERPSESCNRCGHENAVWSTASPLWNAVMRGGCINGDALFNDLVCAGCFMVLAAEKDVATSFRVTADTVNLALQTTTPSGRKWDEEAQVWQQGFDAPLASEGS